MKTRFTQYVALLYYKALISTAVFNFNSHTMKIYLSEVYNSTFLV